MDEFVLRLIRVAQGISLPRIAGFFGFSEFEIETVILPMMERGLIQIEGDVVVLAKNGQDLFTDSPEGDLPRIAVVESRTEGIWFELISKNMMRLGRFRPLPGLLQLVESPDARRIPEKFAADAFERNFHDYALRIRRHPDADNLAVYSVSDVEPGTYGYQLMPADFRLDLTDGVGTKLEMPLLAEDPAKYALLGIAATNSWNSVAGPERSSSSLADYERLTGDQRLGSLYQKQDDPGIWIDTIAKGSPRDEAGLWGAIYLDHNIDRFCEMIARPRQDREAAGSPALIWLRPGGTAWGRTVKVADALQSIRQAMASAGMREVQSTFFVPRSVTGLLRRQLRRLFDAGRLVPTSFLPPDLEILLIPGIAAIVALHVKVGRHTVAAGIMTQDNQALRRIERRFNYPTALVGESLWEPRPEGESGSKEHALY